MGQILSYSEYEANGRVVELISLSCWHVGGEAEGIDTEFIVRVLLILFLI